MLLTSILQSCGVGQQGCDIQAIQLSPHNALLIVYDTIVDNERYYYGHITTADTSCRAPIITQGELAWLLKYNGRIYSYEEIGKHRALWDNITNLFRSALQEGDTVYTLLRGDFANIAIEAVPLDDSDSTYLFDVYHIHRISSLDYFSKDKKLPTTAVPTAVLFGDIAYNNNNRLKDLRGSQRAIAYLKEFFPSQNIHPTFYCQSDATTDAFRSLSGQTIDNILLSTHGDIVRAEDGIPRYSLAFYDAKWVDARQIAKMDLSGIQTILITACRSGQYKDQPELCLQTMFKGAHANTIIMHIWDTNDSMAERFIQTYYTEWLSGKTPHEAFMATKTAIRRYIQEPYYWARFIMLD